MRRVPFVLLLATACAVFEVSAAEFYFVCQSFPVSDTTCETAPLPDTNVYLKYSDMAYFFGGDSTSSSCFTSKTFRFYSLWCNSTTGMFGAQQFVSPDCSDAAWAGNPTLAAGNNGKTVSLFLAGDCYFDANSQNSIKYMGCTDDIAKIPAGYKPWSPSQDLKEVLPTETIPSGVSKID